MFHISGLTIPNLGDVNVSDAKVYPNRKNLTSVEDLDSILKGSEVMTADENSFLYSLDGEKVNRDELIKIINSQLSSNGQWEMSGSFFYPDEGFMSWHTNNDAPGIRAYFTYSWEEGNIFRYRHPVTGEIIDSEDKVGWNLRAFHIDPKTPLWHCVIANTKRLSFGFNCKAPTEQMIEKIKIG